MHYAPVDNKACVRLVLREISAISLVDNKASVVVDQRRVHVCGSWFQISKVHMAAHPQQPTEITHFRVYVIATGDRLLQPTSPQKLRFLPARTQQKSTPAKKFYIGSRFRKSVGRSSKIRRYDKKRNIDVWVLRICVNIIATAVLFCHN